MYRGCGVDVRLPAVHATAQVGRGIQEGEIQPIQDLAQITHQTGVLFHTDSLYQEFVCEGCKQRLAVIL